MNQNSKKTESLAQLKFSLDNQQEEKKAQLQVQQLKEAEEIQDYQKLEELAQNFNFLTLENFLSSNNQTHKITLATYKTSNFRQKILFGFKTKAFMYADLKNFTLILLASFWKLYRLVNFYIYACFTLLLLFTKTLSIMYPIFAEYLSAFESSWFFSILKTNIIFFFISYILYFILDLLYFYSYYEDYSITEFFSCKDDHIIPLEIKLYDSKKIKLPEFRFLFKELQAMKLQPKLQISICEYSMIDSMVESIDIADLNSGKVASMFNDLEHTNKPIEIKIEIEINKNKFTN